MQTPPSFSSWRNPDIDPAAGWTPHTDAQESRTVIEDVLRKPESYAVCLKPSTGTSPTSVVDKSPTTSTLV